MDKLIFFVCIFVDSINWTYPFVYLQNNNLPEYMNGNHDNNRLIGMRIKVKNHLGEEKDDKERKRKDNDDKEDEGWVKIGNKVNRFWQFVY